MNKIFKIEQNINLKTDLNKNNLIVSASYNVDNSLNVISKYSDDVWDFSEKNKFKSSKKTKKIFFNKLKLENGEPISEHPELLESLKDISFKMICEGMKTNTISHSIRGVIAFFSYMKNILKLNNVSDMNIVQINYYLDYIINKNKDKSQRYIISHITPIKTTLFKYRNEIKDGLTIEPFIGINYRKKIKSQVNFKEVQQTEIIPDSTWKEISAVCISQINKYDINSEDKIQSAFLDGLFKKKSFARTFFEYNKSTLFENYKTNKEYTDMLIYTQVAAAIIIQAYTGMRISELESLKTNCILKDNVVVKNESYDITKIKGLTFKYLKNNDIALSDGRITTWLCPPIVEKAVSVLTHISNKSKCVFEYYLDNGINLEFHQNYKDQKDSLFLTPVMNRVSHIKKTPISNKYIDFLESNGVQINFKLSSHCFRRTIARFFARTIIDIPIEALKEQFKHYSTDITEYYMKEDENSDSSFMELVEGYSKAKESNNKDEVLILFKKMQNSFDNAILTASNIDDLLTISNGRQIKVINDYLIQLDDNRALNPLESLTCNGIIILPEIHKDYWQEMLVLYEELIELEPNSIWHKKEKAMIESVVNKLNNNEAFISNGEEQW